jgi:nucleoside-diphosphate-sugar epimerase
MKNAWENNLMKILVTDGAGLIGGTVTGLLLAAGHSPTVFDNLSHSNHLPVAKGQSLWRVIWLTGRCSRTRSGLGGSMR